MNDPKTLSEVIGNLIDCQRRADELFAKVKGMMKKMPSEPRIKVSPAKRKFAEGVYKRTPRNKATGQFLRRKV